MTDNEIIKAITETMKNPESLGFVDGFHIETELMKEILNLINRQKAVIEEKSKRLREILPIVAELKAEAIKEFAERVKEKDGVPMNTVDNLVKEMTEEKNNV